MTSVGIRYFVSDPANDFTPGLLYVPEQIDPDRAISWSPRRTRLFFVSRRGDLESDAHIFRLEVFNAADILNGIQAGRSRVEPVRVVEFGSQRSREDYAGISMARWDGEDGIRFMGVQGAGDRRMYRLNVQDGRVDTLSAIGHDVANADRWSSNSYGRVYLGVGREDWRPLERYPLVSIRDGQLAQLEHPERFTFTLYGAFAGGDVRAIASLSDGPTYGPWLSPNGRYAIAGYRALRMPMPPEWAGYERSPSAASRYMLLDLAQARSSPLLNAPVGGVTNAGRNSSVYYQAYWSDDSRHVLLVNTALPLDPAMPARRSTPYIVDYDVTSGQWSIVSRLAWPGGRITQISAGTEPNLVNVVMTGDRGQERRSIRYSSATGWRLTALPPQRPANGQAHPHLEVRIVEDTNRPANVVASFGGRQAMLTEEDPALQNVHIAQKTQFDWVDDNGRPQHGLLMLPSNCSSNCRVPLIIQANRYAPGVFRPDGVVLEAFAAQEFAARGYAVLEMNFAYDDRGTTFGTPTEMRPRAGQLDTAVERLSEMGLIDASRVGVIGFSRSGYSLYYVLTHPGRVRFAAATIADSITASFGEYVYSAGLGDTSTRTLEAQYGGSFWNQRQRWLEDAPSFNVDRVRSPVLFFGGSLQGELVLPSSTETIGAFTLTGKPFEYFMIPQGSHGLQRPRERYEVMRATVEWMDFWLKGEEPPVNAVDPERAARWRALRAQN